MTREHTLGVTLGPSECKSLYFFNDCSGGAHLIVVRRAVALRGQLGLVGAAGVRGVALALAERAPRLP